MDIKGIIESQREYFNTGITMDLAFRRVMLKRLRQKMKDMEEEILNALYQDLGKNKTEAYMSEVGMVYSEIDFMLKNIKRFSKTKRVLTPLVQFKAKSYRIPCPYGVVLIMSPWNYPFMLTLTPLIDALASGNTAVLKPSDYSHHTSLVIEKLIHETFPSPYVHAVLGGRAENQDLLNQNFDYIFFTGGKTVGRLVMEKASAHLTPVTLELGGKSPCIVDETAHISLTAKRIAFGKLINVGQTCIAPDYILVHESVHDALVEELKKIIPTFVGNDPIHHDHYGHIINQKHFDRLMGLLDPKKIVFGGESDLSTLKISPTIMTRVTLEDPIMQEEIFGPILPILTFQKIEDVVPMIEANSHPLAFYYFTTNKVRATNFLTHIPFGGGCINDTIVHIATNHMGFGGVGDSGMGEYHGKYGFDTFTHTKSVLIKSNAIDISLRYPPYHDKKDQIIRRFLK
ncbi:MAG: aldehyde dehydrogenase [Bacilli bacterium]|nr:aldehyde dehydrogenase [Bacilli bacterium]